jgi:thioredoxin
MSIRSLLALVSFLLLMLPTVAMPVEKEPLPRLLDLGADKCIPCRMMAPILDALQTTLAGKLQVEFIDVWKHQEKADAYGVRMIPTQIFFSPTGQELFRHQGFISREDILAKWRELGYDFNN